jgi:hypothetical protein
MTNRPSRITKIVFFVESYFNQRDYERFGIETFVNSGFDVEVWDFTPFIAPDEYRKKNVPPRFDCNNWVLYSDKQEALAAIAKLSPSCFVISLIHYELKSLGIHRLLSRAGIKYCVDTIALPAVDRSNVGVLARVSRKMRQIKPKVLLKKLLYLIPYKILGVSPADFVLARGQKYATPGLAVADTSEIIWAHSYDYDNYLREGGPAESVDKNTGVFLDEYLPFHPDFAYSGLQVPVTPEEYYPKLCRFFDYLEKNHGVKIIVAAHPRSRYEDHPDFFGGRLVARAKTLELVKKSGFVIMHTSTAINFAILYRKPVIIVTTNKYNEGWNEDPTPDWLASFFGKKAHNLDYPLEFDYAKEIRVDDEIYNLYKNAYIKKDGTEDLQSWQILANRIKDIQ